MSQDADSTKKGILNPWLIVTAVVALVLFNLYMHFFRNAQNQGTHVGTFGDFLSGCAAMILVLLTLRESSQWRKKSLDGKKREKAEFLVGVVTRLQSFLIPFAKPVGAEANLDTVEGFGALLASYRRVFLEEEFNDLYQAKETAWIYFQNPAIEKALSDALLVYDELRQTVFTTFHAVTILKPDFKSARDWLLKIEKENWLKRASDARSDLIRHLKGEHEILIDDKTA